MKLAVKTDKNPKLLTSPALDENKENQSK